MITPEPPAGSEHYREGWRHGYEQAAIDRERSAEVQFVLDDNERMLAQHAADVAEINRLRSELEHADHFGRGEFRVTSWAYEQVCRTDREKGEKIADLMREVAELRAGAVPDTGQAREPDTEWPARRELEGVQRTIAAIGGDAPARAVADYVAMRLRALDDEPGADAARWTPPVQPGDTVQAPARPVGCPSCSGMLTDRDCDDRRPARALLGTDTTPEADRG